MYRSTLPAIAGTLLLLTGHAAAQDPDPQGRGVARISLISGDVSVRRGDTNEWVLAAINAPLLSEDRVLTGANSRTEVQFDHSNFARLAGNAEMRLADIENRRYLVRLASGTMTWRVLRDLDAEVEISTPSIAIRPAKKGIYRVSVRPDGSTEVTVRSGEAEICTPKGSEKLRSGRTLLARGSFSDPEFQTVDGVDRDDFDRWSESRDRELLRSRSYDHVSRDIYGAEDLDNHGRWVSTPEYGSVWVPVTSPGWAPYRYGRWSWVDYYGWSWISYDPWGWAPYHYGRWFNRPGIGWCWWPGAIRARHHWSPALVGFFGWGGRGVNVGIGVGFGNWGWVPLAPYETYYPWYGRRYYGGYRTPGFVNNSVNITNVNITNVYRNARIGGGYTVINGSEFGRGSVNPRPVRHIEIGSTAVMRGQLPAAPGRDSLRWTDRAANAPQTPVRGDDRFFSRSQPRQIDRVSFENQRAALQQASDRTFGAPRTVDSPARGTTGWQNTPATTRADLAGGGQGSGVPVVGAPSRGDDAGFRGRVSPETPANSDRGGWRRLGEQTRGNDAAVRSVAPESPARSVQRGDMQSAERSGAAPEAPANSDRGNWRRLGEQTRGNDAAVRGVAPESPARSVQRGDMQPAESSGAAPEAPAISDRGNWRRMGDQVRGSDTVVHGSMAPEAPARSVERGDMQNGERGSWRRFGSPGAGSNSAGAPTIDRGSLGARQERGNDSSGWGRFGTSSRADSAGDISSPRSIGRPSRLEGDRSGGSIDRSTIPDRRGSGGDYGGLQTIPDRGRGNDRMSAPVVRERPDSGGGGRGGFSGGREIGTPRSSPNFGGGGAPQGGGTMRGGGDLGGTTRGGGGRRSR